MLHVHSQDHARTQEKRPSLPPGVCNARKEVRPPGTRLLKLKTCKVQSETTRHRLNDRTESQWRKRMWVKTVTLTPAVVKDTLFSSLARQEPSGPTAHDRCTARATTNSSRPFSGTSGWPVPCPQDYLMDPALGGWGITKLPKTLPLNLHSSRPRHSRLGKSFELGIRGSLRVILSGT